MSVCVQGTPSISKPSTGRLPVAVKVFA